MKLQDLQGTVIECSSCNLRTLLPADGVDGLVKNMELLKAVLQTEEEKQKLCNFCIQKVYPPKPGTFYCSDCDVFTCGSCSDDIHSQLEFRMHDISLATVIKDHSMENHRQISSRPLSSCSTLSKKSSINSSVRPGSSLLDYSAVPGNLIFIMSFVCSFHVGFQPFDS